MLGYRFDGEARRGNTRQINLSMILYFLLLSPSPSIVLFFSFALRDKAEFKSKFGKDYTPGATAAAPAAGTAPAPSATSTPAASAITSSSDETSFAAKVAEQGEQVRVLKSEKKDKATIDAAVKELLVLKVGILYFYLKIILDSILAYCLFYTNLLIICRRSSRPKLAKSTLRRADMLSRKKGRKKKRKKRRKRIVRRKRAANLWMLPPPMMTARSRCWA